MLKLMEFGGVVDGVVRVKRGQQGSVAVTGVESHLHTETAVPCVVLRYVGVQSPVTVLVGVAETYDAWAGSIVRVCVS